jgi:hypothetical protein
LKYAYAVVSLIPILACAMISINRFSRYDKFHSPVLNLLAGNYSLVEV